MSILLNSLRKIHGRRVHRVGRGHGAGAGKTAGYGHGGSRKRSGKSIPMGFEGGQTPIYKRLPKFGFTSRKKLCDKSSIVNLDRLQKLIDNNLFPTDKTVDLSMLKEYRLIRKSCTSCKVLGGENFTTKINMHGLDMSAQARAVLAKLQK